MSDTLPALAGDPNVLVTALAKAAAMLAAQNAGDRTKEGDALDRKAIEDIAEGCVREAFLRIGVDLSDHKSVRAFNDTLAHAERGRGMWDKVGATVLTGVVMAIVAAILAAIGKYGFGGVR